MLVKRIKTQKRGADKKKGINQPKRSATSRMKINKIPMQLTLF